MGYADDTTLCSYLMKAVIAVISRTTFRSHVIEPLNQDLTIN